MKKGINIENLDKSINPKDNFYLYSCGGWMEKHPLTGEFSSFGTFDLVRENSRKQLQDLILGLSQNELSKQYGTVEQKISDLYLMGMDEKRLNEERFTPLKPILKKIEDFKSEELIDFIAWLHNGLDSSFFSSGVGSSPVDSDMNILHIGETGLGLGDRDYYLEKSEENKKILEAYEKYVKTLMRLIGKDENSQQRIWDNVIFIETEIAKNKMTREERRNPLLHCNLTSLDELKQKYNNIDWDKYFRLLEIKPDTINVNSPGFLNFINSFLFTLSEEQIKDYLTYSIVSNSTSLMSDDFINADFELYGKVMSGQKELKPRWKRAMGIPNSMFGEAVGELYVKKYFPEENKNYMLKLVERLREALRQHIENLSWMSETTKQKAKEKLESMTVKIGYPDKWKDYSEIQIDPKLSYVENVQNASKWFTRDNYNKLNKPVDKTEWHMTPQTVNAYYSPISNEICFPAAILQPPYFDINADDSINYGAIGAVIGHEMTHGFDDQGRQFDKNGNLNEWWEKEDADNFNKLAHKLEEQFDKVEILPGLFANGKYTLGENIADQGGLRVALTAYLNNKNSEDSVTIDGFDDIQRFYLSYAGLWASNITDEEIRLRTKSDPHSLGRNRVNVTLRNLDPFFIAFDINEGDEMFRSDDERVIIW